MTREPEVVEEAGPGIYPADVLTIWRKGPVAVTLHYDLDAPDPRKEFDHWTDYEVEAWEAGEVFTIMVYRADGEYDACGGYYGEDYAETTALWELEQAWKRYVEDCERITAWAHDMGRTLPDTWITTGVAV